MEIGHVWICLGGIWVLGPCGIEPKHHFGTARKGTTFFHLTIVRHQNTKTAANQPPKMIELGHFLEFSRLPEKNDLLQLLLITL